MKRHYPMMFAVIVLLILAMGCVGKEQQGEIEQPTGSLTQTPASDTDPDEETTPATDGMMSAEEEAQIDQGTVTDEGDLPGMITDAKPQGDKTKEIYLIVPTKTSSATLIRAVESKAGKLGYTVKICEHSGDVKAQTGFFRDAINKNAAGIICDNASSAAAINSVSAAKDAGVPTILVNNEIDNQELPIAQLVTQNYNQVKDAASYLLSITGADATYLELYGPQEIVSSYYTSDAFHEMTDQYGPNIIAQLVCPLSDETSIHDQLTAALETNPDVAAVVCYNEVMAKVAAMVKQEKELSYLVFCLDGSDAITNELAEGSVTASVEYPAERLGEAAVTQLDAYLKTGETGEAQRQLFDATLITPSTGNPMEPN